MIFDVSSSSMKNAKYLLEAEDFGRHNRPVHLEHLVLAQHSFMKVILQNGRYLQRNVQYHEQAVCFHILGYIAVSVKQSRRKTNASLGDDSK